MKIRQQFVFSIIVAFIASGFAFGQAASSGTRSTRHDAVIKGSVVTDKGKPVKKTHITLTNVDTDEKMETVTDKSGRFHFNGLFSGTYKLDVSTKTGQTASDQLSLGDGETATRKLIVKPQA